jgi:CubicO group peptidase (beta-lactamase class C family)
MKKYAVKFLVCSLLLTQTAIYSQNIEKYEHLEKYIQAAVDSFEVPGLAVGIVKNGEIVYAKGFGVKSTTTDALLNIESLFGIASLSKAFTAAAMGILVDEGKLNWSDRVVEHLPRFQLYDPYITREVRIADLLSHRVGLATFDGDLLWYGTDYTRKEIVKRIRELPIKNSFRDKYGYQNIMFIVAGEVIEAVSGITWEEFVQTRLFDPIGMSNSTLSNSEFDESYNVALPHLKGKVQKFINYDNSGPAASINSCVSDMLKWADFWLNKGKVDTLQLLSEKSYYKITSSYTAINRGRGEEIGGRHFTTTGLGWFLNDYAGRKIITHGGGLPGYLSRIALVPEDSLGIVVFQNDMQPVYRDIESRILDVMLNHKTEDYVGNRLQRIKERKNILDKKSIKKDERIDNTNPSFELEKYAGVYSDKMYGDAEVTFENEKLVLTLLPTADLFTSEMIHWHFDTFRIKFNDPFLPEGLVTFNKNSKGKITGFTIDLPNPDFHFYNLNFLLN